ncbi:MAG: EpsI family protein [Sedimentisphaerales bacterium]|nr:EpsI family protein [Sedimentisphaerales bacterium]
MSFRKYGKKEIKKRRRLQFVWILAIVLLLASGEIYRAAAQYFNRVAGIAIKLPVAMSNLPFEIGNWKGSDLEIPANVREYMERNFADDYVSRRYVNSQSGTWADVYMVYCATRPGGLLGHQPLVCYPGNGWIHDDTQKAKFTTQNDKVIECLIHRFHKPAPDSRQTIVLNFYIINGRLSTNEKGFRGFSGRKFNFTGNPARYAAQVQISSVSENAILVAAKDLTELMLNFLPDEIGIVHAADIFENVSGLIK